MSANLAEAYERIRPGQGSHLEHEFSVRSGSEGSTPYIGLWDDEILRRSRNGEARPAEVFLSMAQTLRDCGFEVMRERIQRRPKSPFAKQMAPLHLRGYAGRVRFALDQSGRHVELEFYADPNPTHAFPRYGRDVMGHLPYIDRVRVRASLAAIRALLTLRGYTDKTPPPIDSTMAAMEWRWRSSGHFVAGDTSLEHRPGWVAERQRSNTWWQKFVDSNGQPFSDGDVRCFYDKTLQRGRLFLGLNGQWEGVTPNWLHYMVRADGILGALDAAPAPFIALDGKLPRAPRRRLPRVHPSLRLDKLKLRLAQLVKAEDFERAIPVRNLIRAQEQK